MNPEIQGLRKLQKFYEVAIKKIDPKLAAYIRLLCFLHMSNLDKVEISFEVRTNSKKPRPKDAFARASLLLSSRELRAGERKIEKKYGLRIGTRKHTLDTGPAYEKFCRIPKKILPPGLTKRIALHQGRERKIEKAGGLFEKISGAIDDVYSGSRRTNALLARAAKLYLSAKPETLSADWSFCRRGITKFFNMKDLNIDD